MSPGCDGITAEHLIYGKSDLLFKHLSVAFSVILCHCVVPDVIRTGIIIPLLIKKKKKLKPNTTSNYKPGHHIELHIFKVTGNAYDAG